MNLPAKILALSTGIAGLALTSSATVLYNEQFANTTGSDKVLATVGWDFVSATNSSSNIMTTTTTHGVVHAGLSSDGASNGYIYAQPGAGGGARVFTDTNFDDPGFTFDDIGTISFDGTASITTIQVQILLQANSTWYVSNQIFTLNNLNSFTTAQTNGVLTYTLDFATSTWSTVSFEVGAPLSVTASSEVLSNDDGAITGIGLLVRNTHSSSGSTVRLDNLVVTAVPEPATAAAFAGLGVLGLAALRRRSRR